MDSTDFAIVMVSGVLIIIVIFLFILFKIFGKNKRNRLIVTLLPEITKIGSHESRTEKFVIRPQEIEGLEKEFKIAGDFQKRESEKEIIMEKKEDTPSYEPGIKIGTINETVKIQRNTKEEPLRGSTAPIKEEKVFHDNMQSIEDNEKLKLEDILIEIRDVNTQKKAKKKSSSSKNIEKAPKLKERENPEKKPIKRPARKKQNNSK
jgi:predicted DNA-binding ribbon-helix-helix protein